ncbi:MAG: hypothetical protein HUJ77_13800 [Clostridium sp.]|uniref:hypothetical protein n=1 Tax=Clostridium sp. TaxID=1506 RepID=UPI0025BC80E0|nr:hypothetical protein [Clostridium sp.]MCF0149453.1 hypothetical protein [Clostridium sp.]
MVKLKEKKDKELFNDTRMNEKPKFKDLVAMVFRQYLIILPIVFGFALLFMVIVKLLLLFWK